jgi:hypothetical protein
MSFQRASRAEDHVEAEARAQLKQQRDQGVQRRPDAILAPTSKSRERRRLGVGLLVDLARIDPCQRRAGAFDLAVEVGGGTDSCQLLLGRGRWHLIVIGPSVLDNSRY